MMGRSRFAAVCFLAVCLGPQSDRSTAADSKKPGIYQQTLRATALVAVKNHLATAWVVDRAQKLLVTNHHVVEDEDTVLVLFPMYKDGKLVSEKNAYKDERGLRGKVLDTDVPCD